MLGGPGPSALSLSRVGRQCSGSVGFCCRRVTGSDPCVSMSRPPGTHGSWWPEGAELQSSAASWRARDEDLETPECGLTL